MNLKNIILSERSQIQKTAYILFNLYEMSRIGEKYSRLVVARGWRRGE